MDHITLGDKILPLRDFDIVAQRPEDRNSWEIIQAPDGQKHGVELAYYQRTTFDLAVDRHTNQLGANLKILEVGCASGTDSRRFAEAGHRVTATDIMPRDREIAIHNAELEKRQLQAISFISGDFIQLKAARQIPEDCNVIHCGHVGHLWDLPDFKNFIGTPLKENGIVAFSYIDCDQDFPASDDRFSIYPEGSLPSQKTSSDVADQLHRHRFSEVHHAMQQAGLEVLEIYRNPKQVGIIAMKKSKTLGAGE